jgi:hypothetical protein
MVVLIKTAGGSDIQYLKALDMRRRLLYALSSEEVFTQGEAGVNQLNTWLTQPWEFHIISDIDPTIDLIIFAGYGDEMEPLSMADHIAT